ncbi:MAG: hypothetical protein IPP77_13130 [Bacteroidetes bacterium]|nr:hypothetical protein [Bacteroidota bacterium]
MTTNIILLVVVLVSGLLTVFIFNSIINSRIKGKVSENENPISIDILKAILFLCGGLLLSEIINTFQTMTKVLPSSFTGNDLLLKEIMFFSIFLGIALLVLFVNLWLSAIMFGIVSKEKNIFIEVANNNLGATILFVGILLALTFAAKAGLSPMLDQFIPYPTMPTYH